MWSEPINLGKEINSANDDWGYVVDISGETAYFAGNNYVIGYGGWDIYSIALPKTAKPEKVAIVRGKVKDNRGNPLGSVIKWEDLETGELAGTLMSDPRDGYYFIALKPGRLYGYYAQKDGYYPSSKHIDLRNVTTNIDLTEDIILTSAVELAKENVSIKINNLFFDFAKAELKKESFPELNRLIAFLNANKAKKVLIEGHTDNIGTDERNLELSIERANAVRQYLISYGIESDRLSIKGYGASKPEVPNDSEENRALNRRVIISFSK
jgi:outer membrane protein OmpA-like peptidoglycan-associated protein